VGTIAVPGTDSKDLSTEIRQKPDFER
jgi:hypothetical protein